MRNLCGESRNFNEQIVGKIRRRTLFPDIKNECIYVGEDIPLFSPGTKAIISSSRNYSKVDSCKKPLIFGVPDISVLQDGDIVLLEPNGFINVLYEKKFQDNVLFVTQKCNCSCIMCPQVSPAIEKDDYRLLNLKLISLMDKNTKHLGITGGEPTVKRGELLELITECKKKLPNASVDLLTNGILFEDFHYVKELTAINHPNLTTLISLYSDIDIEHDRIIGTQGFYKTIKGIYNLALFRQKIEVRTVISALTVKRLSNLSEFIYRNFPFVIHVAFMGLELEGCAQEKADHLYVDPSQYITELEKGIKILHRADMNVSIYNHPLCLLPRKLWPFARRSISAWKRVFLDICNECEVKECCGGLFKSVVAKQANRLQALKNI